MKTKMTMVLAVLAFVLGFGPVLAQQSEFAPAVYVNAQVISQYEVKQRVLFMTLLRQPGDITKAAMSTLIDDSLRREAAKALDVTVSDDEVKAGMAEFASRAKLPLDEFVKALGKGGVEPETLRDFVEAGLLWRGVIRAKFVEGTKVSDAEIDRAIGAGAASGGELRVLLSEIVIPTGGTVNALALAQRLKLTATTPQTFSMAAQNYSKSATARAGGVLGWIPVSALPPAVAPRILALKVGEVSDPISIPGAGQLFLLRDKSMSAGDAVGAPEVEYAQFFAPAGTNLAAVRAGVDTCDDLYDAARGLPAESLQRATVLESGLAPALRAAVAGLDAGETAELQGTVVMLCSRKPQSAIPPSRDDVGTTLLNTKLSMLAGAYLTELKSNAYIRFP
ncbi:MAG: peptidylprolyl isomerase [Pseudorhodobacter sp.]|nr:peptidylprolyl isomerase [Pseudorhodobacter sp.]